MLLLAIFFTVLFVGLAAMLAVAGVHGPDSLAAFAIVYVVAANVVWWWSFVRFKRRGIRTRYFALVGVGLATLAFVLGMAGYAYSELVDWYRVQHVTMASVHDRPLLDAAGRPIGIRLEFTATFPMNAYYWIEPQVGPADGYSTRVAPRIPARAFHLSPIDMRTIAKSVEPFPAGEDPDVFRRHQGDLPGFGLRFERGVPYRFRFDLAPAYLRASPDGRRCIAYLAESNPSLSRDAFDAIVRLELPTKYQVRITDTAYGGWRSQEPAPQTEGEYVPKAFYDGITASNAAPCAPGDTVTGID